MGGSTELVLPAVKRVLKPLGGVLVVCSTQECPQPLAGRLGDGSVVLTCSAHLVGA